MPFTEVVWTPNLLNHSSRKIHSLFLFLFSFLLIYAGAPFSSAAEVSLEEHFRLGKLACSQNRWQEAEEHLRVYRKANPQSEEAAVLHAMALVGLGQPFDAMMEVEEVLKVKPNYVPALKTQALLLIEVRGEQIQAEDLLVKCTQLDPKDLDAWKMLGANYLDRNRPEKAIPCFLEAVKLAPDQTIIKASLANGYEKTGELEKADEWFRKAHLQNQKAPRPDPHVDLLYGEFLLKQNREKECLPFFQRSLMLNKKTDSYYGLAMAYFRLKDYEKAEANALASLQDAPQRRDARQLLLRIHKMQNKPDKVEEDLKGIEQLGVEDARAENARREISARLKIAEPLIKEGKYAEAQPYYEQILEILPGYYEAYFALGSIYTQMGQMAKAETALKKYLLFERFSADGHSLLGLLLLQQGRSAEAQPELHKAVEIDPAMQEARQGLARACFMNANYAAARQELEKLLVADPRLDAEYYVMLAECHKWLKEPEKAISVCERGLEVHPGADPLESLYAELLLAGKDNVLAYDKLMKALSTRPASPSFLKAYGQLLLKGNPFDPQTLKALEAIAGKLPGDPDPWYFIAEWHYHNNNFAECLNNLNQALSQAKTDEMKARYYASYGRAQSKLENIAGADEAFQHSLELNRKLKPPNSNAAYFYVEFLTKQLREADAQKVNSEILQWDPQFVPARMTRARWLVKQGQLKEAIQDGNQALANAGEDSSQLHSIHAFLAKTYFAMGQRAEAQTHQRWIESHPAP
jgi:tetratricopeptide (TPR) repeat protein